MEFWGGGCDDPELGLASFVRDMSKAMARDRAAIEGVRQTTGYEPIAHEVPHDRPGAIYERNGVTSRASRSSMASTERSVTSWSTPA